MTKVIVALIDDAFTSVQDTDDLDEAIQLMVSKLKSEWGCLFENKVLRTIGKNTLILAEPDRLIEECSVGCSVYEVSAAPYIIGDII